MIVNPAYIYYGKSEPLPDFNLWDGSVVNVPYALNNAEWSSFFKGFIVGAGGYVEFTVNSKGYNKFKINAYADNVGGVRIDIGFYNSSGSLISTVSENITSPAKFYTVDIPNGAKMANAKIRINNTNGRYGMRIYSATLLQE